jgi:RNA polymerase-interacting CarD/CdnL/TRCF family regulator
VSGESLVCPGCGGPKSKRAELCRKCRRKANAVGATVVAQVVDAQPISARLRTPEQNRVYHGVLAKIANLQGSDLRFLKRRALAKASQLFDREIASSTELTEIEMERLLEWLDTELDRLEAIPPEPR